MNLGDVVRVTSEQYPGAAREGTVTEVTYEGKYIHFTINELWYRQTTFSTEFFDVETLVRFQVPEPKEIGAVYVDVFDNTWTRFTDLPTDYCWINKAGRIERWKVIA